MPVISSLDPVPSNADSACQKVARDTINNNFNYIFEDTIPRCGELCKNDYQLKEIKKTESPTLKVGSVKDVKDYYRRSVNIIDIVDGQKLNKDIDDGHRVSDSQSQIAQRKLQDRKAKWQSEDVFSPIYQYLNISSTVPVNCGALFTDPYSDCHLARYYVEDLGLINSKQDQYIPPHILNLPQNLRNHYTLNNNIPEDLFYLNVKLEYDTTQTVPQSKFSQTQTVSQTQNQNDNQIRVWSSSYLKSQFLDKLEQVNSMNGMLRSGERYSDIFGSKIHPGEIECGQDYQKKIQKYRNLLQASSDSLRESTNQKVPQPITGQQQPESKSTTKKHQQSKTIKAKPKPKPKAIKAKSYNTSDKKSWISSCVTSLCSYSSTYLKVLLYFIPRVPNLQNGNVLIVGSQTPWLEALAFYSGAKTVTTIEYNPVRCEYFRNDSDSSSTVNIGTANNLQENHINQESLWNCYTPSSFNMIKDSKQFDAALSFSSIEHSGLGRYGDTLSPYADFMSLQKIGCLLKPWAGLLLSVPYGIDSLQFNAHRIYGALRLGLLMRNWEVVMEAEKDSYSDYSNSNSLLLNCSSTYRLSGRDSARLICRQSDAETIRRELWYSLHNRFSGKGYKDDRVWVFRKRG